MICSIILAISSACLKELLIGLAMALVPAILGWLAARAYYKIAEMREANAALTTANGELTTKVNTLTTEGTDLRVKLTQIESELYDKTAAVSKLKNDVIIAESERNILKGQLADALAAAAGGAARSWRRQKAAPPKTITFNGVKYKWDDLKIVEGIGPKIEELLHADGIKTWKQLAEAAVSKIQGILDAAGSRYAMHNPATWPEQSRMADNSEWDNLKKYQDELTAGRE